MTFGKACGINWWFYKNVNHVGFAKILQTKAECLGSLHKYVGVKEILMSLVNLALIHAL